MTPQQEPMPDVEALVAGIVSYLDGDDGLWFLNRLQALLAEKDARVTALEAALREWDAGVCWFVADAQGGPCREVWPDEKHLWCASCVASFCLSVEEPS